jgi:hypothetical protein
MDLLTSRIEFRTVFRKLHLAVGLELYRRNYLQSNFMFNGGYIQVTRKF